MSYRKTKTLSELCKEREQFLSELRHKRRQEMLMKKRIELINSNKALLAAMQGDLANGEGFIANLMTDKINNYDNYDEYLKLAENPDFRFVVSNTTEAGIVFDKLHLTELTISDNGKWNGNGIFIDDLTMYYEQGIPKEMKNYEVNNNNRNAEFQQALEIVKKDSAYLVSNFRDKLYRLGRNLLKDSVINTIIFGGE